MLAKLIIATDVQARKETINSILGDHGLKLTHPDLLYFDEPDKLGVEEAKKIRQHLSLKPYQGKSRAIALVSAYNLTLEAQNALLKTLEEPPDTALIILGSPSEDNLLPTVVSRCQVIFINNQTIKDLEKSEIEKIDRLLKMNMEERFLFIEGMDNRDKFLSALTSYFYSRSHLGGGRLNIEFLQALIQAEKWTRQNVNIRAILEYLMLKIPSEDGKI